jgi:ribosome maturation factor RimP
LEVTGVDVSVLSGMIGTIAADMGLVVVDVSWAQTGRRGVLRVMADRPGRITIDECAALSRAIDDMMDREMVEIGPFTLEVGSPGIGRRLETREDWIRCVGRRLKVTLESEAFEEELLSYGDGCLTFSGGRVVPETMIIRAVEAL